MRAISALIRLPRATAAAVLLIAGAFFLVKKTASQSVAISTKPFTIQTVERSIDLATGRVLIEKTRYLAVRSDGSTASGTISVNVGYARNEERDIFLVPASKHLVLNDSSKTKVIFYLSAEQSQARRVHLRAATDRCAVVPLVRSSVQEQFVGESSLIGVRAYVYRFNDSHGDSVTTHERWYSPELDCRVVKDISETSNTRGERVSRFEKVASLISIGEPDPALFVEPTVHQAVIPSEQLRRGRSAGGLPVQETSEQWWLELDKKHADSQKNKR